MSEEDNLEGLLDEEGPVRAEDAPGWFVVDLELAVGGLNVQVVQVDASLKKIFYAFVHFL